MAELPTGTVTFLFTDLEGSTRLWEEHPDAMQGALARHDEILRDAIRAHDGHVVKTTGDGVHAAFANAPAALFAARDAQLALTENPWGETGPLRVRMGIHTCQAEVRDGDYYGSAVNRAARLMSIAHGGQVVLSLATEELAREGLSRDVTLVDLGEHRLRDLTHAERVFQLVAPGLPSEFSRLQSLDAFRTNLPRQLTSFVGRDDELAGVAEALTRTPLVTITGVGGVGKTRLATRVAAEVAPEYRDGVWLCELATVNDADGVVQVVATTLAIQPRRSVSFDECVIEYLRGRSMLIVLDNCEHVLDAAARLAGMLLQACPEVRIVTTSREGLALPGEQVWPLRSLPVPGEHVTVDSIAPFDAARLFADRASLARTGFVIDESNVDAVAEICRRLDGIPLAIELAAARVSAIRPADIAGRLGERFRLLTGGRRTAVERHQTLRATVDWSYSLLDENERRAFERLGVFSGGFDIKAAEAVATGEGLEPWDILDAVASLVDKSMLVDEETADGATRYAMLETLRQYAVERLAETADVDSWRRRHAAYYVQVADEIGRDLLGPQEAQWRRQLRAESDNLRAAVTWALERPEPEDIELAIGIVSALAYEAYHNNTMVGSWAEQAAARADVTTPQRRATVLAAAASSAMVRGDFGSAQRMARASLSELPDSDQHVFPLAFVALAYSELVAGDHQRAVATLDEGERIARQSGSSYDLLHLLNATSTFRAMSPADPRALVAAEEAVLLARQLRNPTLLANALYGLAWGLLRTSPAEALAAAEESYTLMHLEGTNTSLYGSVAALTAQLRARAGDTRGALDALRSAFEQFADTGDRPQLVAAVNRGLRILARVGDPEASARLVGAVADGPLAAINNFPASRIEDTDPVLLTVEAQLGSERYAAARAEGALLSYDEVVASALAAIDRMLAEVGDG